MRNVIGKWVALAMLVALTAPSAFAHHDHDDDDDDDDVRITETRRGPAPYHQVYGDVVQTTVTIEDFFLRTSDGQVFKIPTDLITLDLQNLNGYGKGILVDTTKMKWPQGVQEIDVVEIETLVHTERAKQPYILFGHNGTKYDGGKCSLSAPKRLNLFTKDHNPTNAQGVIHGFRMWPQTQYLVKVDYSALASVQIDLITRIFQRQDCDCDFFGWFRGGRDNSECRPVGKPRQKPVMRCELANRRQPIVDIVRKIDEF